MARRPTHSSMDENGQSEAPVNTGRHVLHITILLLTIAGLFMSSTRAEVQLTDFALSSDGRMVAVSAGGTIGLFDWRSGRLRVLPLPETIRSAGGAGFSNDGKSLVAVVGSDAGNIATFDLPSMQMTGLHRSTCWPQTSLVFRPDDSSVLFGTGSFPQYLCLYDLGARTTSVVLQPENGFYSIISPTFTGPDTALFTGIGPKSPTIMTLVEKLGVRRVSSSVPYRLKLGELPEIVYPDLVRRGAALTAGVGGGPTSFAASRNGERIIFIDRSLTEENRMKIERTGPFRYDLFVIEKGMTRQVTHLETYLGHQAISYDGSTGAFGIYAKPMSDFRYERVPARLVELAVVDLQTGAITKTDLMARLNADPRFHRKDNR
ncbi:MAG: WD40 repeat domain-containing protein [Pseudomonadota bacterium]